MEQKRRTGQWVQARELRALPVFLSMWQHDTLPYVFPSIKQNIYESVRLLHQHLLKENGNSRTYALITIPPPLCRPPKCGSRKLHTQP